MSGKKYKKCCFQKDLGLAADSPAPPKDAEQELSLSELRDRLEAGRLELRALYRTLDRCNLCQSLPPALRTIMELDADLAEGLWTLDQPQGKFDLHAMQRDMLSSLSHIPGAYDRLVARLTVEERKCFLALLPVIRDGLGPEDAYIHVPGRDPSAPPHGGKKQARR
jgi:hypothetical protein